MISDDWKDLEFEYLTFYIDRLRDCGYQETASEFEYFINQVKLIKEKQLKEANKNVAAILRK